MSVLHADARSLPLVDGCVQCCVTSPPYFGLRDYGTARWVGGDAGCAHKVPATGSTQNKGNNNREGSLFRGVCGVCGAERVDAQIGLEPTPDAYIAQLVAVFREVRRVLKDDGVLWLNLGDSYNSGTQFNHHSSGLDSGARYSEGERGDWPGHRPMIDGLRAKNMLGIPWRVAFALQQPYYTGRIARVEDRVWLAAIVDGEGSICIERQRPVEGGRARDCYVSTLRVHNTSEAIVRRCAELTGLGTVRVQDERRQTVLVWCVYGENARAALAELYPYLVAKQQQARLALSERNEHGYEAMKALHAGGAATLDAPAPESLHVPGWYLRSDIIWAKPNPMPESVTDRPTKAHEYLFLLAKSQTYYYDAQAIAEPVSVAMLEQVEQGYKGLGLKDYESAGAQNPSSVKARIVANAKERWGRRDPGGVDGPRDAGIYRGRCGDGPTRNRRTVWTVPTMPYAGAHFATMPEALVEPCILAGSRLGDLVLDPFLGSGTVGAVAERLGRRWVGCDLNPAYHALARKRTAQKGLRFA